MRERECPFCDGLGRSSFYQRRDPLQMGHVISIYTNEGGGGGGGGEEMSLRT